MKYKYFRTWYASKISQIIKMQERYKIYLVRNNRLWDFKLIIMIEMYWLQAWYVSNGFDHIGQWPMITTIRILSPTSKNGRQLWNGHHMSPRFRYSKEIVSDQK